MKPWYPPGQDPASLGLPLPSSGLRPRTWRRRDRAMCWAVGLGVAMGSLLWLTGGDAALSFAFGMMTLGLVAWTEVERILWSVVDEVEAGRR